MRWKAHNSVYIKMREMERMMKRTKLATVRYERGWSQSQLAEKIGVSRETISLWERGITEPYPHYVRQLCELFGETADELDLHKQEAVSIDMSESRRTFLQVATFFGAELFTSSAFSSQKISSQHPLSQTSLRSLRTITQQFRNIQRQGEISITQSIHTHIVTLMDILSKTTNDTLRQELWQLLSQSQLLACLNPMREAEIGQTKTYNELAIAYAQTCNDMVLTIPILA